MKVYAVIYYHGGYSASIKAICSTREKANKYIKEEYNNDSHVCIREFTLDTYTVQVAKEVSI